MSATMFAAGDEPLIVGRAPILPFAAGRDLFAGDWEERLLAALRTDPLIVTALHVASPSLGRAAEDWAAGKPLRNRNTPLRILAYVVRMATRTTPFGLFASVSLVDAGATTTLRHGGRSSVRTLTRPDMRWLFGVIDALETDVERRCGLRLRLNDLVEFRGGRAFVSSADRIDFVGTHEPSAEFAPSSFQWTSGAEFVAGFVREREPSFDELAVATGAHFNVEYERAEALIDKLYQAGLLVTELRASPVGDPFAHVQAVLDRIGDPAAGALRALTEEMRRLDELPLERRGVEQYRALDAAMRALHDQPDLTVMQVDARHSVAGTLGAAQLDDVARLAEILAKTSLPLSLRTYRERFVRLLEGLERELPLTELVDRDAGIGPVSVHEAKERQNPQRDHLLFELIGNALNARSVEATVTAEELETLTVHTEESSEYPSSLELSAVFVAPSAEAVSSEEYLVVPGAIHSTPGAGRSVARLAELLGNGAVARLRSRLRENDGEPASTAELVYPAAARRGMNVMLRPRVYDREVHVGTQFGPPASETLYAKDLIVGLDHERFYVRTPSGERLTIAETHLLNTFKASTPICQFLASQPIDNVRYPRSFHWGPAAAMPFLPRLRFGRLVISPARWRLPKEMLAGDPAGVAGRLKRFGRLWNMPDVVTLAQGDNTLMVDVASNAGIQLLIDQVRAIEEPFVILVEAIREQPSRWYGEGSHALETIVSLTRRPGSASQAASHPPAARPAAATAERAQLPGSGWLYVRLYCRRDDMDRIVVQCADELVGPLLADGLVKRWFFVRYGDDFPHLRLRVEHDPHDYERLVRRCSDAFASLVAAGVASRFAIDTYQRELERYGGSAESCAAAETLFFWDSAQCAELLRFAPFEDADTRRDAIVSLHSTLVAAYGSHAAALAALGDQRAQRRKLTPEERALVRASAPAIAELERAPLPGWLIGAGASLRAAAGAAAIDGIAASLIHMHFNRLGISGPSEAALVAVLRAAYLSLLKRKAPELANV